MSNKQTQPYNSKEAALKFKSIKAELNKPGTSYIVFFGSVVYFSEAGKSGLKQGSLNLPTTTKVNAFLDCRYIEALSAKKTHFYVINGANDSGGESGTTYTTSTWVNNHNVRCIPANITVKCFGLAPHETCDMNAIWMEEHGHTNTRTFIVAKTAQGRRERLVELAKNADESVVSEGGIGTLDEITMLYETAPEVFEGKVFIANASFLIDTVIPAELAKLEDSDSDKLTTYKYFQTQLPAISI